MTFDVFVTDERTRDAVIRDIEVIGEAAKNLPDDIIARAPEVEWRKIRGMRNVLERRTVWRTERNCVVASGPRRDEGEYSTYLTEEQRRDATQIRDFTTGDKLFGALAHGYFDLEAKVVWDTATTKVDALEYAVRRLLA